MKGGVVQNEWIFTYMASASENWKIGRRIEYI